MDRRTFIKASAGLALIPLVPSGFAGDVYQKRAAVNLGSQSSCRKSVVAEGAEEHFSNSAKIALIAVGGAGSSTLSSIINRIPSDWGTYSFDTDPFSLQRSSAKQRVLVGDGKARPGSSTELVALARSEKERLSSYIGHHDAAFIIAGEGGITGTNLAPIVAEFLLEKEILVTGVGVTPFSFEGGRRKQIAQAGLRALRRRTSSVIEISNQRISDMVSDDAPMMDVLDQTGNILLHYASVASLALQPESVGIEIEDVRATFDQCIICGGAMETAPTAREAMEIACRKAGLGLHKPPRHSVLMASIECASDGSIELIAVHDYLRELAGADARLLVFSPGSERKADARSGASRVQLTWGISRSAGDAYS